MTFTITAQPSGRTFEAQPDETLLAAGIRQGVGLPYGCQDGACGACKCRMLAGSVTLGPHLPTALSDEERAQGYVLTCRSHPTSDVTLQAPQVTQAGELPVRKMPARVARLERLAHDVIRITLQLPAGEPLRYHAGQYLQFILPDGARRSYSMANAPHTLAADGAPMVELHVRHTPGGAFTDRLFGGALKEKEILRVEAPFGSFRLQEDSAKPIILLASGTGFAPIKALIEHLQFIGSRRPATLYWGGRRPRDLYLEDWVKTKLAEMPQLRYVPVVSDALPEDHWQGRTGFVHRAVLEDWPDLSGHQVYACGAPIVIDSARNDYLQQAALPPQEFYADAFINEADKAREVL